MRATIKNNGTKTSAFGSPGRINHDATTFYESRLYEGLHVIETKDFTENPIQENYLNRIFIKSSERMEELPDNSIHLMVTSPPYNVGKEYDDNLTLKEYRELIKNVWQEVYRVLVPGGRACVNIANLGRKPYLPLHSYIISDMLEIGYLMRGEIIWNKANSGSPSTAWGSWLSAKNPILRDIHEYILIFSKGSYGRQQNKFHKSTINKEEFLELTKSVWTFSAESARKIGHPAPFPLELPYRLIQLYTFENDVVLDPFMGSGQTAIAAVKSKRNYIGYDINKEYVSLAEKRIKDFVETTTTPTLFGPPPKSDLIKKQKLNKNKLSATTVSEGVALKYNPSFGLRKSKHKSKKK